MRVTCRLVFLAVLLLFAAPAMAQERFDGVTLRVATFGGPWRETMDRELSPRFAALGGKLAFVTGSPQANFAKLVAGRGRAPFDVIELIDAQLPDYAQGKYLAPIDLAKVPNTQFLDSYQFNDHMVATWSTEEGICYNVDKFKELGIAPPTGYKDLAQPALAGRVMIPDINSGGGLAGFGGFVFTAGGDETHIQPGLALIKSIAGVKFWSQGDQVVLGFQSGDIYAAAAHAGWCMRSNSSTVHVAAVHPVIKPGVVGVAKDGWLGILATSPNAAAATWFVNAYLDTQYQYAYAVSDGVVPVNRLALAKMALDPKLSRSLELDPQAIAKELRIDYAKVSLSDWTEGWNRMIAQ